MRTNGLPVEDLEQPTPSAEDFTLEPSGHVTNSAGDQGEGGAGTLGGPGRFSPQELHKEDSKCRFCALDSIQVDVLYKE